MLRNRFFFVILIAVVVVIAGLGLFSAQIRGLFNAPPPLAVNGITVVSPQPNELVSSPLKIIGSVNGGGWNGFEGQVGTVSLVGADGQKLAQGILTATSEWTKPVIAFSADLSFVSPKDQVGALIFKNENPSGLPDKDKEFRLPVNLSVNLATSTAELTTVKVFFTNNKLDPEISCTKVFAVEREIVKTPAVGQAALRELLAGPTELEKADGFGTVINPGVVAQKLTIEDGVARADFNGQLEWQVGGSCRVSAIRAQIEETLKQFPTIKEVVISINGQSEDILQP